MTIIEAIKSNKPFRLPTMLHYIYCTNKTGTTQFYFLHTDKPVGGFTVASILSHDWSLLEVPDNVLLLKDFIKRLPSP